MYFSRDDSATPVFRTGVMISQSPLTERLSEWAARWLPAGRSALRPAATEDGRPGSATARSPTTESPFGSPCQGVPNGSPPLVLLTGELGCQRRTDLLTLFSEHSMNKFIRSHYDMQNGEGLIDEAFRNLIKIQASPSKLSPLAFNGPGGRLTYTSDAHRSYHNLTSGGKSITKESWQGCLDEILMKTKRFKEIMRERVPSIRAAITKRRAEDQARKDEARILFPFERLARMLKTKAP
eukprot:jgi/Botrbrau1/2750/Bobra.0164s0030.1